MSQFVLLFFCLLFCPLVFAEKFAYPPHKIPSQGIHQIKISGVKGRLRLKGTSSKSYSIKVRHSKAKRFEDWSLSVDRQGEALVLEVFNVAYGPQWRNLVREELWPEFDIELEGPSVPAVISWREGDLQIRKWQSEVESTFLNGRFSAQGMRGNLKLQAVDTQVLVTDHVGALVLKGEKGRVELERIKGAVDLNWLHGVLRLRDLDGPMTLAMPSGNAEIKNARGKIRAKGSDSEWTIQASAPSDVEVISESGPVKVRWGSGGAKLFLSSADGQIRVPKPFHIELREGLKVVEGLKQSQPRGLVFVRTQSGSISWQ